MDSAVIDAINRWPNVPGVFGWLSLSARGHWRLHPDGLAYQGGLGEPITNPQILAFINRNYTCDATGRWLFQNGPQRVYVRLDAAPWIVFADDAQAALTTHTGQTIHSINQAWVDETGRVFVQTEHGVGMIIDRDLPRFLAGAMTKQDQTFEHWWAGEPQTSCEITQFAYDWSACASPLPVSRLQADRPADEQLMFIANPKAS